jgi:hypothetical protein
MSEFDKIVKEANSQVKERKTSEEPRHYIVFDKTEVEIDGQKKSLMDFYKSDIEPITSSAKAQAVLFLKLIRIHKATEVGPKSTREKTSK